MSTIKDQLAQVRAARAQHYREHKVTEAVQATKDARIERERQESGGSNGSTGSGNGIGNGNGDGVAGPSRKRESRADSSDEEIEWIEGPVSKKAAMGNGNGRVSSLAEQILVYGNLMSQRSVPCYR